MGGSAPTRSRYPSHRGSLRRGCSQVSPPPGPGKENGLSPISARNRGRRHTKLPRRYELTDSRVRRPSGRGTRRNRPAFHGRHLELPVKPYPGLASRGQCFQPKPAFSKLGRRTHQTHLHRFALANEPVRAIGVSAKFTGILLQAGRVVATIGASPPTL